MADEHDVPKGGADRKVLIEVCDLWKSYEDLEVLKGINLKVKKGETIVILGRSGAGKSVLLRQIIGIEFPDKGHVEIDGKNLSTLSEKKRAAVTKHMGMLFQGAALFDSLNINENTAFYLRQHERYLSEKDIQSRVDEALTMVGLDGTQQKMPADLSGGMRKRAALARLIVYRPEIVLYDEPTTGLDPITAMSINTLINRTQEELQSTSIVVTHDIPSALEVGDRLAFHHDGIIIHIAPKKEFLTIDDPILTSFFHFAQISKEIMPGHAHKESRSNHV
ncbi:MAG: ATP-binding cassette domain-containing protein [Waddliaceae bacterium]